jgi:hypothetical protein
MTLRIRQSQMDILSRALETRWHARHLGRCFASFSGWSGAALCEFVEYGRGRARAYGIASPRGLSRYLNVMAAHGKDFDQADSCRWWTVPVLRAAGTMDEERLTRFLSQSALAALRQG